MGRYGRAIQREIEKRQAAEQANQQLMASLFLPMKLKREEGALNRQAKMRELTIRYANERKQQEYLADQSMQREILKAQTALAVKAMGGEGEEKPTKSTTGDVLAISGDLEKDFAPSKRSQAAISAISAVRDFSLLSKEEKEKHKADEGTYGSLYDAWIANKDATEGQLLRALSFSPQEIGTALTEKGKSDLAQYYSDQIIGMGEVPEWFLTQMSTKARANIGKSFDPQTGQGGMGPPAPNIGTEIEYEVRKMYQPPQAETEQTIKVKLTPEQRAQLINEMR